MEFEHFIKISRGMSTLQLQNHTQFRESFQPYLVNARFRVAKTLNGYNYSEPQSVSFLNAHKAAWATFVKNLSQWEEACVSLQLPKQERLFIAGWQFPEIPMLFPFAKKMNALLLVSQDAPWLKSLKEADCTLNIRSREATFKLKKSMKSGRIIAGLLDHHQLGTRYQEAQLFGRTVKTPSGVLALCIRYEYQLAFIAPRSGYIEIVEKVETAGMTVAELAQLYNDWLEAEIHRKPEQWLMWQAYPVK